MCLTIASTKRSGGRRDGCHRDRGNAHLRDGDEALGLRRIEARVTSVGAREDELGERLLARREVDGVDAAQPFARAIGDRSPIDREAEALVEDPTHGLTIIAGDARVEIQPVEHMVKDLRDLVRLVAEEPPRDLRGVVAPPLRGELLAHARVTREDFDGAALGLRALTIEVRWRGIDDVGAGAATGTLFGTVTLARR